MASGAVTDELPPKARVPRNCMDPAVAAEVVAAQHGAAPLGTANHSLLTQPWLPAEGTPHPPAEDRLSLVDAHVVTSSTCVEPRTYPEKRPRKRMSALSRAASPDVDVLVHPEDRQEEAAQYDPETEGQAERGWDDDPQLANRVEVAEPLGAPTPE